MKIYISHPIAGKTEQEKRDSEDAGRHYAERQLLASDVVLPRRIPPYCGSTSNPGYPIPCTIPGKVIPGDDHSVQCYMRGDIAEMLTCDAILVMPGWQASTGCRDEVNVAAMCGLPIHFFNARVGVAASSGVGGIRLR